MRANLQILFPSHDRVASFDQKYRKGERKRDREIKKEGKDR